jgi:DTW domain-containing protein YfiP
MQEVQANPLSENAFTRLHRQRLTEATREFHARGKSVGRCERCQLARFACLCAFRPQAETSVDFVLLLHRDEILKPTNTGRLVADVFPTNTYAFTWDRTEPPAELIDMLNDPTRHCLLVFPEEANAAVARNRPLVAHLPIDSRKTTFILLDGTWKQSGRMFHLSRWLDEIACVVLPEGMERGYAVRKSHQDDYVSTAEAAALCLHVAGEQDNASVLVDYFTLFNRHYVATRHCVAPEVDALNQRLLSC